MKCITLYEVHYEVHFRHLVMQEGLDAKGERLLKCINFVMLVNVVMHQCSC